MGLSIVLGLGCEANSRGLDPPVRTDTSGDRDAGFEPGVRLFSVRVGFGVASDTTRFQPRDLTGWILRARSDLGESTPVIEGPGRFSVRASGRLELTAVSPDPDEPRYFVSTEASHVDLISPGGRDTDADGPRPQILLDLELAEPWSAGDVLTVRSSGLWVGQVTPPASAVGRTQLSGVVVEADASGGRLVGEDLWVLRHPLDGPPTSEPPPPKEAGLVRSSSVAALDRPIAVRLARRSSVAPGTRWSFPAWVDGAVSDDWGTRVLQHFVRTDRVRSRTEVARACLPSGTAPGRMPALGRALSGVLPGLDAVPEGYVVCTSAVGYTRRTVSPETGLQVLWSEACSCGERPAEFRVALGAVRSPLLDGRPLDMSETVVRAPVTLSWQPPARGVARGYVVHLDDLRHATVVITDATEVTLPEDVLPMDVPLSVTFVAIDDQDLAPVESPFIRSARWQLTQWSGGALRRAP